MLLPLKHLWESYCHSNIALYISLAVLTALIFIIQNSTKRKLYDNTPANILGIKKINIFKRSSKSLYGIILFIGLQGYVLYLISQNSIIKTIVYKPYELKNSYSYLPNLIKSNSITNYYARLSTHGDFPSFTDSIKHDTEKLFTISLPIWNSGTDQAVNINMRAYLIGKERDMFAVDTLHKTPSIAITEIDPGTGIREGFNYTIKNVDTTYILMIVKYSSYRSPKLIKSYKAYFKSFASNWYGSNDREKLQIDSVLKSKQSHSKHLY